MEVGGAYILTAEIAGGGRGGYCREFRIDFSKNSKRLLRIPKTQPMSETQKLRELARNSDFEESKLLELAQFFMSLEFFLFNSDFSAKIFCSKN